MNLINANDLKNKKVLITGATGLIGQSLVRYFLSVGAVVLVQVRNLEKANFLWSSCSNVTIIRGDIKSVLLDDYSVDYIIHAASPTDSKSFVCEPVETIENIILGTKHILEFAKKCNSLQKFVYLSTMEVYGTPGNDEKINELHSNNIDTLSVRSCYPESKRLCENMCTAYFEEYNVPINVLRLTQTFGPGVQYNDKRVFAEFARSVIEKKDILLKTKGETCRNYLHVEDAVSAIVAVMLSAPTGEVYNVANEETYCSIYEMAKYVATVIANNEIKVLISENNDNKNGYAPVLHMNLDTRKIRELGWNAEKNFNDMFKDMINDMKNCPR